MSVNYVNIESNNYRLGSNIQHGFVLSILDHFPQSEKRQVPCDTDILGIEAVANILQCSVDRVRRISRKDLPARKGPGKALLYLRSDILKFVQNLPTTDAQNDKTYTEISRSMCASFDIKNAKQRLSEKN